MDDRAHPHLHRPRLGRVHRRVGRRRAHRAPLLLRAIGRLGGQDEGHSARHRSHQREDERGVQKQEYDGSDGVPARVEEAAGSSGDQATQLVFRAAWDGHDRLRRLQAHARHGEHPGARHAGRGRAVVYESRGS